MPPTFGGGNTILKGFRETDLSLKCSIRSIKKLDCLAGAVRLDFTAKPGLLCQSVKSTRGQYLLFPRVCQQTEAGERYLVSRLNIEEHFWSDPRFRALSQIIGDDDRAIGQLVRFWRLAQEQYKQNKKITEDQFRVAGLSDSLFDVGFAEKFQDGIVARGAQKHFDWLLQRKDAGRKGGINSGKSKLNKINSLTKANASKPKPPTPTPTPTPKKETTYAQIIEQKDFDFEAIYKGFPRKRGKTPGLKTCSKEIKTQEDFDNLKKSVCNFSIAMKKENRAMDRIIYFSTFMNQWRDHIEYEKEKEKQSIRFDEERI